MSEIIYQDDNILVIAIDDKDRNYTYSVIRKPLEKAVSSATQKMSSGMPAILHPKCIQSAVSSAVPLQTGIDGSVDINKMPNNALLSIIAHRDEIMLKDTEARILANRDEAQEKA
ncbi:MAG: hypothetical protein OXL96_14040 [Candidatus Poribacteria bacterium]|nr:hypothetical protein [Candidatus Poribacteria bacterium]